MVYFLVLIALILIYGISEYSNLVSKKDQINKTWSLVKSSLKKRNIVISNISEVTKELFTEDTIFLDNLEEVKKEVIENNSIENHALIEDKLQKSLSTLKNKVDNNTAISNNETYIELIGELTLIESEILKSQNEYNNAVIEKNKLIEKFPSSLVAKLFKYKKGSCFKS